MMVVCCWFTVSGLLGFGDVDGVWITVSAALVSLPPREVILTMLSSASQTVVSSSLHSDPGKEFIKPSKY